LYLILAFSQSCRNSHTHNEANSSLIFVLEVLKFVSLA